MGAELDKVGPEINKSHGGPRPHAGRKPGTPNKITATIRAGILAAYEQAGGEAYLLQVAKDDPRTFCGLLAKILPTQVEATEGTGSVIASILGEIANKGRPIDFDGNRGGRE
jgi:hypothetical protein